MQCQTGAGIDGGTRCWHPWPKKYLVPLAEEYSVGVRPTLAHEPPRACPETLMCPGLSGVGLRDFGSRRPLEEPCPCRSVTPKNSAARCSIWWLPVARSLRSLPIWVSATRQSPERSARRCHASKPPVHFSPSRRNRCEVTCSARRSLADAAGSPASNGDRTLPRWPASSKRRRVYQVRARQSGLAHCT